MEDDVDVFVTRSPGIFQELAGGVFVYLGQVVAQPIESLTQRLAPLLVPARVAAGVATAIAAPAFDAVDTAPGSALEDFHSVDGRMLFQVFPEIRELGRLIRFDVVERVSQRHLAETVVMSVGFAVGRDVNEFGPGTQILSESGHDAFGERFSIAEKVFESDSTRDGAVVEKQIDLAARGQSQQRRAWRDRCARR